MKIALATIQTPFIEGGAEYLLRGLQSALADAGHKVERISLPFRFSPPAEVARSMEIWETEDFTALNGHQADLVMCLQFPAYYVQHPRKVLWLMHQFRMVYDLWETPYAGGFSQDPVGLELQRRITEKDTKYLAGIERRFTIAKNVSARLERYNGLASVPLYHPPAAAERFFCAEPEPYVLVPSRLEQTKRQDLLLRALPFVDSPMVAILCGDGGQRPALEALALELKVRDRVFFLGHVTEEEKWGLYAHATSVFFGPYDEDYGYVTLEAMLSAKPVVTCSDSGGPLEFLVDNETGLVVPPEPEAIAQAINRLNDHTLAQRMGRNGKQHYREMEITWDKAVACLTET